jgi:lipopolysaccharide assembly outer membrane protein LptD (OstA)
MFSQNIFAQNKVPLSIKKDSIQKEVLVDSFSLKAAPNDIKSKIYYEANDSMVYDIHSKKLYLYNDSKIDYEKMNVKAYFIEYDWTQSMMSATQKIDSGKVKGKPVLKQEDKTFNTEKIMFNFKTQKGKVFNIITKENEGYLHGEQLKRDSSKNWYVSNAKYTTCDLEHPHFYIGAKKLKLIPDKYIITGPANLNINDIPTVVYLPFGMFPTKKGRRSGIIMPTQYGFSPVFNLQGMGYYLGISDHLDMTLLSSLFFNGSWSFSTNMRYSKKYSYTGNLSFSAQRTFIGGDADDPNFKARTPAQFSFAWNHNQDIKAHPTFNFSSNINYITQGYFNQSIINNNNTINSQISSNLNLTKRFRYLPLELKASMSYIQNLATKSIYGTMPTLQVNYTGNIFKTKSGNNWSDRMVMSYNSSLISKFASYDSLLFSKSFFEKLGFGMQHNLNLSYSGLKLFKYINISPNIAYTDRMYAKKSVMTWNGSKIDTTFQNGFYNVMNFSFGLNMSTNIVGIANMSRNGKGLRGLRHQMTPSVSYNYTPDFSKDFWGYYSQVQYNANGDKIQYYSYDNSGVFAAPGTYLSSSLGFSLNNTLEAKFFSKKDTVTNTKKMNLLDAFNFAGAYNFAADSFNLSTISMNVRNNMSKFLGFNINAIFDPYSYVNGQRTKEFNWSRNQSLARMTYASASIDVRVNSNNTASRILKSTKATDAERNYMYQNYHQYYDFNSPWNLTMTMQFNLQNTFVRTTVDTTLITASIMLSNFDFNLTPNWKIAINSGYDLINHKVGITNISAIRNMHCWEIRFNYSPVTNYGQAYSIEIRPKSPILQDLKISRTKPQLDNYFY